MRSGMMIACLTLAAVPAIAQDDPPAAGKPTVEGYLCTFAGKCGGTDDEPQATRAAPRTKGFRLARPVDPAKPSVDTAAVRPAAAAVHPARYHGAQGENASYGHVSAPAYTPARVPMPAGTTGPRANLFIGFKLNSAELTAEGLNSAQVFARALTTPELRNQRFLVEGHTDLRGGTALNASLSARRADAVAAYLASLGVDRSRLQTRGFGAAEPLPGRRVTDPANRRVEAVLLP